MHSSSTIQPTGTSMPIPDDHPTSVQEGFETQAPDAAKSTTYVASVPIRTEQVLQSAASHGVPLAAIDTTVDEQEVSAEWAITEHSAWAAMQRELAAGDRIMERAFCAGPVDRLTIGMPVPGRV